MQKELVRLIEKILGKNCGPSYWMEMVIHYLKDGTTTLRKVMLI